MQEAAELSLADFLYSMGDDPLQADPEYVQWRKAARWAMDLYEPHLFGAPVPRVEIQRAGERRAVINLTSYNYLGLATHPKVIQAAQAALETYGTGACGSPVLSGLADLHRRLEQRLSAFMERGATMLFNSGFGGAMGALSGLLRKGDAVIMDEKCHLSLIAGGTLGHARMHFFKHNDPESLDQELDKTKGKRRLVVVEGVYSMDGDMADLPALTPVIAKHKVGVFIDEAHSMGCWGAHGRGVADHFEVEDKIGMVFATFSKAFAAVGGFVSGQEGTIDYLRYYSHPYGFSCALPPAVVAGLLEALKLVQKGDALRKTLWENTEYFREKLLGMGLNLGQSTSQVIPLIIGSDRPLLYEMCHELYQRGLFLAPVDYPSVPEDELRYRVAVTAAHTRQDLDEALQIIQDTIVPRILRRS